MKEDIVFPPENNRHLRLAVQAGLYFITDKEKSKVDENGTLHLEPLNVYDHFDLEKFAELIIKECIQICEGNGEYKNHTDTEWGKGLAAGIELCQTVIKSHFGVE